MSEANSTDSSFITLTAVPPSPIASRSGIKTSEFWLSTAATVFFALVSAGVFPDTGVWVKIVAIICAVLATLGYGQSRAAVKMAANAVGMLFLVSMLLVMTGCPSVPARPTAPNLGRVLTSQIALAGVEFYVEELHSKGKIGDNSYATARAAELAASDALDIAAKHASANTPLTDADNAAIGQSFRKVISDAILANNPELAGSLELHQIETIIDEITPATQPVATQPAK